MTTAPESPQLMKAQTIDEFCGEEQGSFAQFIKQKRAFLESIENERKDRIRDSRKAACELSWAA